MQPPYPIRALTGEGLRIEARVFRNTLDSAYELVSSHEILELDTYAPYIDIVGIGFKDILAWNARLLVVTRKYLDSLNPLRDVEQRSSKSAIYIHICDMFGIFLKVKMPPLCYICLFKKLALNFVDMYTLTRYTAYMPQGSFSLRYRKGFKDRKITDFVLGVEAPTAAERVAELPRPRPPAPTWTGSSFVMEPIRPLMTVMYPTAILSPLTALLGVRTHTHVYI